MNREQLREKRLLDGDDERVDVQREEQAREEQPRGVEQHRAAQEQATHCDVQGIPRILVGPCGDNAPHGREVHPRVLLRHLGVAGALDLRDDSDRCGKDCDADDQEVERRWDEGTPAQDPS
eukprot:CAMPEP_0180404522 /NCGR_PEP_ID=MMETSP0989-20121125/40075_1 /TAXON_ID=697907 /ORGANISM="non described non described, Strain CCMP2293" /LENGTH=120 /DNA_ID=CAMNT_0022407973 /DNA_START=187 /DNA_END=550 /DNA_ORIENTATION=+